MLHVAARVALGSKPCRRDSTGAWFSLVLRTYQRGAGMAAETVAAGWYPDHHDAAVLRWWDGTQWTASTHVAPAGSQPGTVPPAAGAAAFAKATAGRHERRFSSKRDLHL